MLLEDWLRAVDRSALQNGLLKLENLRTILFRIGPGQYPIPQLLRLQIQDAFPELCSTRSLVFH